MDETLLEYGVFITPDLKVLKLHTQDNQLDAVDSKSANAAETKTAKRGLLALASARKYALK